MNPATRMTSPAKPVRRVKTYEDLLPTFQQNDFRVVTVVNLRRSGQPWLNLCREYGALANTTHNYLAYVKFPSPEKACRFVVNMDGRFYHGGHLATIGRHVTGPHGYEVQMFELSLKNRVQYASLSRTDE